MSLSFFEKLSSTTPMTNQQYLERIDFFRRLIENLDPMRGVHDTSAIDTLREAISDLEERMAAQTQAQRGFRG